MNQLYQYGTGGRSTTPNLRGENFLAQNNGFKATNELNKLYQKSSKKRWQFDQNLLEKPNQICGSSQNV